MVHNSGTMEDISVEVLVRHFILCEVVTVHMDESAPGAFNETVGALYFVGGVC